MRILHVVEAFAGGVFTYLEGLIKEQIKENEVYVAYGIRPLTPKNVETYFDERVHFILVKSFNGAWGTMLNPKAYYEIRKIYKEVQPDIVHLHSSSSGFLGRIVLPCLKTPVFYTPNGYAFLNQKTSKINRAGYYVMEKLVGLRPATTIACSKGEYELSQKLTKHSTYVSNGIDIDKLDGLLTKQEKSSAHKFTVCTSGRILTQKNPALFNEIATLLPEVHFVWIGDGEKENNLRYMLTSPNIEITGWKSREESVKLLQSYDIFILTSIWEGLPLALLEAMYLKKVCIVTDVVGNRDAIKDQVNGYICTSPADFADRIRSVMNDQSLYRKLSQNAYNDVIREYNTSVMNKKYTEIYKKALLK